MPIRVTQILYSGLGGHGAVVFSLVDADLQKQWTNSLIFYGVEKIREEYRLLSGRYQCGYTFIEKQRGLDLGSYRATHQALSRQKPDIILLHNPSLIVTAWWYRLFRKTKVIMVEHNANHIKRKSEWLWSLLGMILADRIVYLTELYSKQVKEKLGVFYRRKKVSVIPNGLDLSLYKPRAGSIDSPDIIMSMVGRFAFPKRQDLVVDAFLQFRAKYPGLKVKLIFAGDGETRSEVERRCGSELGKSIFFPGMLNEAQIIDLLQSSDFYVHASAGETMSTSIMQAMACGACVLGSDVSGINNIINGENGWLFSNDNPGNLSEKLHELIQNPALKAAITDRARQEANSRFSHQVMFRKYAILADEIVK